MQIDGRLIKVWELDIDDLIELQDEIMGEEGELDPEMKQYINECRIIFVPLIFREGKVF